jgi:hypothetical protein
MTKNQLRSASNEVKNSNRFGLNLVNDIGTARLWTLNDHSGDLAAVCQVPGYLIESPLMNVQPHDPLQPDETSNLTAGPGKQDPATVGMIKTQGAGQVFWWE